MGKSFICSLERAWNDCPRVALGRQEEREKAPFPKVSASGLRVPPGSQDQAVWRPTSAEFAQSDSRLVSLMPQSRPGGPHQWGSSTEPGKHGTTVQVSVSKGLWLENGGGGGAQWPCRWSWDFRFLSAASQGRRAPPGTFLTSPEPGVLDSFTTCPSHP